MNRFIDDVSVLAIEDCLIGRLSQLFRPRFILNMSPEDISRLAGETEESSLERDRLGQKRKILEMGLQGLKSLLKRRDFARPVMRDPAASDDSESKPDDTSSSSGEIVARRLPDSVRVESPVSKMQDEPAETFYQNNELPIEEPAYDPDLKGY